VALQDQVDQVEVEIVRLLTSKDGGEIEWLADDWPTAGCTTILISRTRCARRSFASARLSAAATSTTRS
jgi:hypothetical protein